MEHLKPYRREVFILLALLLGSITLKLVAPKFIGLFLDELKISKKYSTLLIYITCYILLSILQNILQVLLEYRGDILGWSVTNDLRRKLFSHCLYFDQFFHETHSPGNLIERIDGDTTYLANFFSLFAVKVSINFLSILGTIIFFGILNIDLGLIFLLFTVLSMAILYRFRNIAVSKISSEREMESKYSGFLAEHYEGFRDVVYSNSTFFTLNKLQTILKERLTKKMLAQRYSRITGHIGLLVTTTGNILAIICTYYLFIWHEISLGDAFLIFFYIQFVLNPLDEFVDQITDFQSTKACIKRLLYLLTYKTNFTTGEIDPNFRKTDISLSFKNVNFSYKQIPILKDVSFNISAGETLGIIGRTGSGKSTILKLIFKLYSAQEGSLLFNDVDIKSMSEKDVRSFIGYDVQETGLINTTVRENLRLFNTSVSDAGLLEAIDKVGLNDWLNRLPDGLDTEINTRNLQLSGGEAQLFKLARLFLQSAGLLLIDEPTAKLDKKSEEKVIETIEKLCKTKTTIIVTHKPDILHFADRILIIDDGKIMGFGPASEIKPVLVSAF